MRTRLSSWLAVLWALAPGWVLGADPVCLIKVEGAIGPATATYIGRALDEARQRQAACLIIQLDTPGGLLDSTKVIVQRFLASPVPTVVYVAPPGASAGSAGCFITLAADVAAMAPTTNIGAAHPVSLGGGGGEQKLDDTMKTKLENYTASYIETIATHRHRNVEWAKASVRESSAITAEKALELKVIDLIAQDLPELLGKLDGREVNGRALHTAGATPEEIPMSTRERVFQLIWRPEVMFVLMLITIYGIIGELSSPGAILPGVVGAIALLLLLYMAAILPVNVAGLALVGLAVLLFVIDLFAPTHGVLTMGGIIAFFLGSLMLFDRGNDLYRLSLAWVVPATLVTGAFFLFVAGAGIRAQFRPPRTGREAMIGQSVPVLQPVGPGAGKVLLEGEYWNAVSDTPIPAGDQAEIVAVEGLTLKVKPKR